MKKILLTGLIGLITLATANAADAQATSVQLNGAGSTFINPAMQKWSEAFAKVDPSVKVNYTGGGSGAGQTGMKDGTIDFGGSDAPMKDEDLRGLSNPILHLPTVAGAVVLSYNITGVTQLKLDGPTVAGIFLKKILKWNDPAIAAQNPDVKLPAEDIVVVHRSDSSGTSFIFTDYLSKISPEWKEKVGALTSPDWPTGSGQAGNAGVAGMVERNPGTIGYVELIYALGNKIPFAEMKNAAGKYVTPSLDSTSAALATADIPADFRFSMTNAPGDDTYPIAGVTWLLVRQQQKDHVKGEKLVEFLKWIYKDGEGIAKASNYAPLPDSVVKRVLATVDTIKVAPAPAK